MRGAYVQHDSEKKTGKDWCFMIISEFDKRTYYICAENKEEMESWITAIEERINQLSFAWLDLVLFIADFGTLKCCTLHDFSGWIIG